MKKYVKEKKNNNRSNIQCELEISTCTFWMFWKRDQVSVKIVTVSSQTAYVTCPLEIFFSKKNWCKIKWVSKWKYIDCNLIFKDGSRNEFVRKSKCIFNRSTIRFETSWTESVLPRLQLRLQWGLGATNGWAGCTKETGRGLRR